MFTGVMALALMFQAVAPPNAPLTVSWDQGPNGAGSSRMGFDPPRLAWQGSPNQNDYFLLLYRGTVPTLFLNTRSGVIGPSVQSPGATNLQGFYLSNMSATPFMLEFTCDDAAIATGWRNNGDPLVVTITP